VFGAFLRVSTPLCIEHSSVYRTFCAVVFLQKCAHFFDLTGLCRPCTCSNHVSLWNCQPFCAAAAAAPCRPYSNIVFLQNECCELDEGAVVFGATLWTDVTQGKTQGHQRNTKIYACSVTNVDIDERQVGGSIAGDAEKLAKPFAL